MRCGEGGRMIIHSMNTKPLLDAKHQANDQNKQNPYSRGATLSSGKDAGRRAGLPAFRPQLCRSPAACWWQGT